jgi:phosphohistidine phosphatase SixA
VHVLKQLDDSIDTALVLGHKPGLQLLVSLLAEEDLSMPTAALAWFELPIDSWSELELKPVGGLRRLWKPKEIDDVDFESHSA